MTANITANGVKIMDSKRVQAILESHGVIEVLHRGRPVWIENLDEEMASVQYLDNREHRRVPVFELLEGR